MNLLAESTSASLLLYYLSYRGANKAKSGEVESKDASTY